MKSLEIIKRKINEIYGFDDKWEEVEELEQVQQDLEILKIFNKLLGDMEIDIWKSKRLNKEIGEIKYSGTDFVLDVEDRGVTIEELKKLKKWIEE